MAASPLVLDIDFLRPGRVTMPRIIGGAVEGGSALSGVTLASDVTGGGLLAIDYENLQLGNSLRDRILFFNRLMVALQGGVRLCVVPFLTDYIAPCADSVFSAVFSGATVGQTLAPFSDGSTFSDGSRFSQPPVSGRFLTSKIAGDGTVRLTVVNGRRLQGGEWFGVQHVNKSFRAYCVTDIDSQSVDGNGTVSATIGIRPTLRDLVAVDQRVDWWRPRCLMRIKSGSDPTLPLQQFWYGTPSLSFVEAL